ncbi:MAG TPA: MbcA/ParS/Xre antitoxin family protein [Terriglobales bacterium]|nr:MbcA/ParS/Xre antitoxin family protein [Terriglobales bacterium]
MIVNVTPDLGLDLRRLPDLAEPETRARLSGPAIEAFFGVVDSWNVTGDDAMALLGGISNGRFYELKRTRRGVLTQDELTRVSLLIGVFKALNILFSRKLADQWVSRPNSNPMFGNTSPLNLLIRRGVPGMLDVRRLLDSRRGGR